MRHRDYPPLSSARTTLVVSLLLAFEGTAAAGAPSRVADLDPNGAEAAQFGEMLEAQIFPTLLQQQIHAILWMGCTPALDATILHLRHRDISVTTVDPLPEHASFVPGGVHLIAPYAQLPAQVERHSVDLVIVMAEHSIADELKDALAAAEHALQPRGWLVLGLPQSADQPKWGDLAPGFREAARAGLEPQTKLQGAGWQFWICQTTTQEGLADAQVAAEAEAKLQPGLRMEQGVVGADSGAAAQALSSSAEKANGSQLHSSEPGRAYAYYGKAPAKPALEQEWVSVGSIHDSPEDWGSKHPATRDLAESSSSSSSTTPDKMAADKPVHLKHSTTSVKPPPRSKSVEELAEEAEMQEAAEEEAAKLTAAATEAATAAAATSGSGKHDSSTFKHRAGSSKASAIPGRPAAEHHSRRVQLPTSKLGANPRTYGHSR